MSREFIGGFLLAFIPSILVAIITAMLTSKLSLKRFYSQRWWERKSNNYTSILESLHHMKKFCQDILGVMDQAKNINKERQGELCRK